MSSFRGQFSISIPAGTIMNLGSYIFGGSVHDAPGASAGKMDRVLIRPIVGSGLWTTDINVGAGSFTASQGGICIGAADSSLPLVVPGNPAHLTVYAIGAMVLTGIFYEGGIISIS